MKFDYTEHKICGHFLSVLINDDPTGLSDEDLEPVSYTHLTLPTILRV